MVCTLLHAADAHLGYAQYGLDERQRDFYLAFRRMAEDAIDSGEALKTLQRMVKASGEPEKLERFL